MTSNRDELLNSIAMLVERLHDDRVVQLANKVVSTGGSDEAWKLNDATYSGKSEESLSEFIDAWKKAENIEPKELALALMAASRTARLIERRQSIEVVWTGPETGEMPVRRTEQVLLQMIDDAKESIFLVSFVAYPIPAVEEALRRAIERGVSVSLLIESEGIGGCSPIDPVARFKKELLGANIYHWPPENKQRDENGKTGVVHAKCAVVDRSIAFLTSANLTEAALERNMEMGLLVRGGFTPWLISKHMDALIETKQIRLI